VRTSEITDSSIIFKGVADEFVAAVRAHSKPVYRGGDDDEALRPFQRRNKPDADDAFEPGDNR
jgi:hypothetical protein